MKNRGVKRAVVGAAMVAATVALSPAGSAEAINRVTSGCTDARDDLFTIYNYQNSRVCFANAGSMAVKIYEVYSVWSGENVVIVATKGYADVRIPRNRPESFDPKRFVTRVQIL